MPDPLLPDSGELRAMGQSVVEWLVRYYESLAQRPVLSTTSSEKLRLLLSEPLPREGASFEKLLAEFEKVVAGNSRHNGHPRFFGYIASPGAPVSTLGAALAATLNINVTSWRSAPAAAEMERVTLDWLKEMLGYPAGAAGLYLSGGSMANFAALAAARSAHAPGDVALDGLAGYPPLCLYVSEEGHFSVHKAAGMLGIGERNVRRVRTNRDLQIDLADLERLVAADRASGRLPFCVVANAGTTASGAFDPIRELAGVARRENLWLHVDAAYGGFAALAPSVRPLFDGIAEADSVALDPHKWLYLPVGCGCVLYKDPATARAAFRHDADYIRTIGLEQNEAFVFWDYGPELSRPFRALDVWLLMKYAGAARAGRGHRAEHRMRPPFRALGVGIRRFRAAGAGGAVRVLLPLRPARFSRRPGRAQRTAAGGSAARRELVFFECPDRREVRPARLRAELPDYASGYGNRTGRRAPRGGGDGLTGPPNGAAER